jgi:hypothetical protein
MKCRPERSVNIMLNFSILLHWFKFSMVG